MEIKQKRIVYDTLEVNEEAMLLITKRVVGRMLPHNTQVKFADGKYQLFEEIDTGGRGSSWDVLIRDATEFDMAVYLVMKELNANET